MDNEFIDTEGELIEPPEDYQKEIEPVAEEKLKVFGGNEKFTIEQVIDARGKFRAVAVKGGDPVAAANIVANWTLYKNSVAIGQGSSGDGASLLYPQTLTDVTGRAANSWQMYSPAASDYFEVIVSSAT